VFLPFATLGVAVFVSEEMFFLMMRASREACDNHEDLSGLSTASLRDLNGFDIRRERAI